MAIFDGDRTRIESYLHLLADLMALRDWHIAVSDEAPENEGAAASVEIRFRRRWAIVRFDPEWMNMEPVRFRAHCVHELLHLHLDHLERPLDNIRNFIGQALYDTSYTSLVDYVEDATDAISEAWAVFLPLPERPAMEEAA